MGAIVHALSITWSMTWVITWALILGFTLSAVVQAVVRKPTIVRLLGDDRPRTLALATGFGAASSSCSYAAVALARSLFRKGASFTAAMAFEIASTYGRRMALFLLGTFYVTMATAGYVVEIVFGGLGLIPSPAQAKIPDQGVSWDYTTWLNIVFLVLADALIVRFARTGGLAMLRMMGGSPDSHEHDHSDA